MKYIRNKIFSSVVSLIKMHYQVSLKYDPDHSLLANYKYWDNAVKTL